MEDEDFVETSDVDELELTVSQPFLPDIASPVRDGNPSPRKRLKRFHTYDDELDSAFDPFPSRYPFTSAIRGRAEGVFAPTPAPLSLPSIGEHHTDFEENEEVLDDSNPISEDVRMSTPFDTEDPPSKPADSKKNTFRRSESIDPLLLSGCPGRKATRAPTLDIAIPKPPSHRTPASRSNSSPALSPPLLSPSSSIDALVHTSTHTTPIASSPRSPVQPTVRSVDSTTSSALPQPQASPLNDNASLLLPQHVTNGPVPAIDAVVELTSDLPDNLGPLPRYSLRQRGVRQLKPYSLEFAEYAHALKSAPDAIVKTRGSHRIPQDESQNSDDYRPEEESVPLYAEPEDEPSFLEQENSGEIRPNTLSVASGVLGDLSSTDEDVRQTRKESKAIKKAKRRAEREANAKDEQARSHRLKRFPMKESTSEDADKENNPVDLPETGTLSNTHSPRQRAQQRSQSRTNRHSSPVRSRFGHSPEPSQVQSLGGDVAEHDANGTHVDDEGSGEDHVFQERLRVLSRMMPVSMASKMLGAGLELSRSAKRRERSGSAQSDGEDAPLRPGQTKLRRAQNPPDLLAIRGDSESSDDERATPNNSSPLILQEVPLPEVIHPQCQANELRREVIELSDDSSDSDSEEGIDDDELNAYLEEPMPEPMSHPYNDREESLIDWMLSRTRAVGITKRARTSHKRSRQNPQRNKPRLDLITIGGRRHGKERQTILNFERIPKSYSRPRNTRPEFSPDRTSVDVPNNTGGSDSESPEVQPQTWKDKQRQRRARASGNGLYTFASTGVQIASGPTKPARMRIDWADEGFHLALTPASTPHARAAPRTMRPEPSSRALSTPRPHEHSKRRYSLISDGEVPHTDLAPPPRSPRHEKPRPSVSPNRRVIQHDLGIPFLRSGLSFTLATFIGKGYLYELIEVLSTGVAPHPITHTALGFSFTPSSDCSSFILMVPQFCEDMSTFANSLPAEDTKSKAKEWRTASRSFCQHLSWFLRNTDDLTRSKLRAVVLQEASQLDKRTEEVQFSTSVDEMGLLLSWFMIDILSRLGEHPCEQDGKDNMLRSSLLSLAKQLITYGPRRSMKPILGNRTLDSSTTSRYSVELWVSLLHIAEYHSKSQSPTLEPLIWTIIQEVYSSHSFNKHNNLQISEELWSTVFSLCALSQFSKHGMTTSTCRLPASWNFVASVMQRVKIVADPNTDRGLPAATLKKRDEYVALVITRCYLLSHTWKWALDGASPMLDQIRLVFRSRNYANLLHERPEYPNFMRVNDWVLLFQYQDGHERETAWILFWKLIVRSAMGSEAPMVIPETSRKVRKQLSLSIPVGAFSFSRTSPPSLHDLSKLYNRISAIAIAIYLDPGSTRISQARQYIDFKNADDTTRSAIIRGIMYFAGLLLSRNLPITDLTDWIKDIATSLADEYREIVVVHSGEIRSDRDKRVSSERARLALLVQLLFGSIRNIIQIFHGSQQYPDPRLLSNLTPLLTSGNIPFVQHTALELRRMIHSILQARISILPRLQVIITGDNQESQDDYGSFDIDMDDPAVLAALGEDAPKDTTPTFETQENAMYEAVQSTNLSWMMWRLLHAFVEKPWQGSFVSRSQEVDLWIFCWLASASVLVRNKGRLPWNHYLVLCSNAWLNLSDKRWAQRLHLGVMKTLLELDPAAYKLHQTLFLEVLVVSLVPIEVTIEPQYFSTLYGIGAFRHLLFAGTPGIEKLTAIELDDFPQICDSLISNMLSTVNEQLRLQPLGESLPAEEVDSFVGLCIKILSTVKENLTALGQNTDKRAAYLTRCQTAIQGISRYHHLSSSPRLAFWVNWAQNLDS